MKIAILISYIIHALFFIALAYLLYKESQALASAAKIKTLISSAINRPITAPAYKSARAEAQAAMHAQNTARLIDICTPKALGTANDGSIKDRLNHLKRQHQDQLNRSKKKPQTQKKRAAA